MLRNRSMPPGTFIPELVYPDVVAAAAWLCAAFGFREQLRIADHRIQLTFGDGSMVVKEGESGAAHLSATHSVMVRVDDVDGHYERARERGATILSAPQSYPFGERQYSAVDLHGHGWTFSQSVADVAPETWGGELVE